MSRARMMSVNRRLAIYRARGAQLTPAQRRRVRKAMNRWTRQTGAKFLGVPS